ncbi:hypothetical protein TNCV_2949871 [Trichonephila clavipes]|nr:hypothetical protein TNCV_2949871 [Trichonephila clavipes]
MEKVITSHVQISEDEDLPSQGSASFPVGDGRFRLQTISFSSKQSMSTLTPNRHCEDVFFVLCQFFLLA